jgi:hypothetical protein
MVLEERGRSASKRNIRLQERLVPFHPQSNTYTIRMEPLHSTKFSIQTLPKIRLYESVHLEILPKQKSSWEVGAICCTDLFIS